MSSVVLRTIADGRVVNVAGLVTHMQRPQTARGVLFASLEDETGIINLIVWPKVFDRYRRPLLESAFLKVVGKLRNREGVVHVVANRIENCSSYLGTMARKSRDFR